MSGAGQQAHAAPRFFHLGYVCRDLDRALASILASPVQDAFLVMDVARGRPAAEVPLRRLSLACVNAVMIEIIEIADAASSIYHHALPEDHSLGFHHHGYLVESDDQWDALVEETHARGGPADAGDVPGLLRYIYVDRLADLGHFVEYVQLSEGGRALFARVPDNRLEALGRANTLPWSVASGGSPA